jgi:hypothetical protein
MQGIVIQGPTIYCNKIVDTYKDIPNVVFSTWTDEPQENIDLIKSKGIEVIQSEKPSFCGSLNVNLQALSTYTGIKYLENKGVTEVLKVRNDYHISDVKLLLDLLKGRSLSFLAICKPQVRGLYYELGYIHDSFDFPIDHVIYGKIKNVEKCFNFQMEEMLPIPPEALIAYSYFSNSDLEFKLDYRTFMDNGISFFMKECLENEIQMTLLKEKYNDIKNMIKFHSDPELYDY